MAVPSRLVPCQQAPGQDAVPAAPTMATSLVYLRRQYCLQRRVFEAFVRLLFDLSKSTTTTTTVSPKDILKEPQTHVKHVNRCLDDWTRIYLDLKESGAEEPELVQVLLPRLQAAALHLLGGGEPRELPRCSGAGVQSHDTSVTGQCVYSQSGRLE